MKLGKTDNVREWKKILSQKKRQGKIVLVLNRLIKESGGQLLIHEGRQTN